MTPTVADIVRKRYWLEAAVRVTGVVLVLAFLYAALGHIAMAAVEFRFTPLLHTPDFMFKLGQLGVGVFLLTARRPLVRWLLPLPRPGCPECGYPITAGKARCSECGAPLPVEAPPHPARPPARRTVP